MFPYVDRESNAVSFRKGMLSLIPVILFVYIICIGMGCMDCINRSWHDVH
jgi:hypothetical protein